MVMSKADAKSAYQNGIEAFGVDNYSNCATSGNISATAECLENAKAAALTSSNMADKWASKY